MYSRRRAHEGRISAAIKSVFAIAFSCVLLLNGCNRTESDAVVNVVDVQFFHDEICPACETYQTAMDIANALTVLARNRKDITAEIHNMIDPGTGAVLKEQLKLRGLPDVSKSIPILLIDSTYVTGYENVQAAVEKLE